MTLAKITITRTRRGLGFPDTQRYVKRAAAAALRACEWDYETDRAMLGDMVISMERCAEQAETYGHSFAHEVSYLTVHSVLHLLGYDHMDEGEDKRRMRAREKEIMRLLDV